MAVLQASDEVAVQAYVRRTASRRQNQGVQQRDRRRVTVGALPQKRVLSQQMAGTSIERSVRPVSQVTNFVRAFGAIYALACSRLACQDPPIWLDSGRECFCMLAAFRGLLLFLHPSRGAGGDKQCHSVMLLAALFEVEWPQSCLLPRAA